MQVKVLFMKTTYQPLETLQDIKSMMKRSSRFISLSGWSGISAGVCALAGAWMAVFRMAEYKNHYQSGYTDNTSTRSANEGLGQLSSQLTLIAAGVFVAALMTAFMFTFFRSRKAGIQIWSASSRRLMWNTIVPMIVGGIVVLRMLDLKYYLLIAPCCLIFYGLALVNDSKYTLGEVKYLGYCEIILGVFNL